MITADTMIVVALESAEAVHAFALGFEAGAMSRYDADQLVGHHVIWAANASVVELMALDRGFTMDVIDSHEDKLLVLMTRTRKAPCPK